MALTMRILVEITVTEDGPALSFRTEAAADLDDEPLYDMDDRSIEATVVALLESLPRIVGSQGLNSFFNLDGLELLGLYVPSGDTTVADGYIVYDLDVAHR